MKQFLMILAIVVMASAAAVATESPSLNGAGLWERITTLSPYTNWDQFPDHKGMQAGRAPHGPLHVVYVNRQGLKKGWPKPYGTILVKENYTPAKKLAAITVMYKVKGYNSDAGDWFWVKYAPDGTVEKAGKPKGCVNCHRVNENHDFIMVSDH